MAHSSGRKETIHLHIVPTDFTPRFADIQENQAFRSQQELERRRSDARQIQKILRKVTVALDWQQYYAAKIMLAVYRKKYSTSEPCYRIDEHMNSNVLAPTRVVGGFVLSELDVGRGINGLYLVTWRGEQNQLLDRLAGFIDMIKWLNKMSANRLRRSWHPNGEENEEGRRLMPPL
ncbi:hypothetical protein BU24DRAFT_466053 [Aaosphaeria arxii CBS 175.79]|uniref:Uncharacterized protein n=1 Tax=Aaosphaeria arxii CBS 175.79 TaxID=1450172 RepID=A0A6A5XEK3_9PLEO|nr:uncharacterized protein BU24DRAFT_466053 [Aaosphaeria arxii CBS 175.79]KAF2011333.1 hypothetical protein BU24DRAFT_466053 [Aaosphaeria arxii CBS 175.79]